MPPGERPNTQRYFEYADCLCRPGRVRRAEDFPDNHAMPGNSVEDFAVEAVEYPHRSDHNLSGDFQTRTQAGISWDPSIAVASRNAVRTQCKSLFSPNCGLTGRRTQRSGILNVLPVALLLAAIKTNSFSFKVAGRFCLTKPGVAKVRVGRDPSGIKFRRISKQQSSNGGYNVRHCQGKSATNLPGAVPQV